MPGAFGVFLPSVGNGLSMGFVAYPLSLKKHVSYEKCFIKNSYLILCLSGMTQDGKMNVLKLLNENGHWVVYQHVDKCDTSDTSDTNAESVERYGSDYSLQPPDLTERPKKLYQKIKRRNKHFKSKYKFKQLRQRTPRSVGYTRAPLNSRTANLNSDLFKKNSKAKKREYVFPVKSNKHQGKS